MQVIWLVSPHSPDPDLPRRWDGVLPRNAALFATDGFIGETAAVIVEIAAEADVEPGMAVLEELRTLSPVWIFEPETTVASSVRWMKAGAAHVATSPEEIGDCIESFRAMRPRPVHPGEPGNVSPTGGKSSLIGTSMAMRNVATSIRMVASRRCNLLIEGETGTGKEVVAREAHACGDRSRGPWVAINCGAIPESLLEAELFGHVKGAFTGAIQARAGKFEAANHGTLFLDEIGDMPMATQAKLLRVLQEREVERLGGNERIKLDVRIVAATNVNLAEYVRRKLFRQDLYYRLNVFKISLPPLREHSEDIPVLARHFIDKVCAHERIPLKSLDRVALDRLKAHSWPGNVRELENAIEAAVIVSGTRTTVLRSDFRFDAAANSERSHGCESGPEIPLQGLDYQRALEAFERSLLTQALVRARGNKTAAADLLGLKRTTLSAKMRVLESRLPRLVA